MSKPDQHTPTSAGWFMVLLLSIFLVGCGHHNGEIMEGKDGTMVLPLKDNPDIIPVISFCKDFEEESGTPEWPDTVFTLENKEWLNAIVELDGMQDLDFSLIHLDWVGPDKKSMFTKRFDVDSAGFISSSVSLSPERRAPGKYILKVYFFRELIAYKCFRLLQENSINKVLASSIKPEVAFCSRKSKKTGRCIDADSVFTIRKKGKVRAIIEISNREDFADRPLKFQLEWIGPGRKTFYTKRISVDPGEDESLLISSISIPPEKREPGIYGIQLKLFGEIISRESFSLIASE